MKRSTNSVQKIIVIMLIAVILLLSFIFGAMSAQTPTTTSPSPVNEESAKSQQLSLDDQLRNDLPIVTEALVSAYPKIKTDYDIADTRLYENGIWFGATLRYKGADTANRDTLRVLMEKKDGQWTLRTKPPTPLLSAKNYPDVPKSIIQDINKVVGLP